MPALGLKLLLIVSLVWLVVIAHAEYSLPRTAGSLSDLYVVGKELGAGAFGRVYEGKAKSDPSRPVAIKQILAKDSTTWVEMNFMMANEAGDFPGIPRLYDIVQTRDSVYIIMQLFIGDDPGRLVWKKSGKEEESVVTSIRRVLDYLHKLTLIVSEFHHRGYVHGDIKPSNTLVDKVGNVILLDFGGTIKMPSVDSHVKRHVAHYLTYTEHYCPHERVHDLVVGYATDIYGLGRIAQDLRDSIMTEFGSLAEDRSALKRIDKFIALAMGEKNEAIAVQRLIIPEIFGICGPQRQLASRRNLKVAGDNSRYIYEALVSGRLLTSFRDRKTTEAQNPDYAEREMRMRRAINELNEPPEPLITGK